jgi:hypothetical protein
MTTHSDKRPGITLAEAVLAGLFGDRQYSAVYKQFQRDPAAPPPLVKGYRGGPAHRYGEDALRRYAANEPNVMKAAAYQPASPAADTIQPYWWGRPEAEIRAAAEAREEQWAPVPGYSRYEWSDKCRLRRVRDGYVMKVGDKRNNDGYVLVNVIRDSDGRQVTVAAAPMVLLAHHPSFHGLDKFPAGLETGHNPAVGDKTFNAYPEGIWPRTKGENNGPDKDPQDPLHPCRNAPACRNMVHNEGKRCTEACVPAVGREAAAMLALGANLMTDVAARFDYKTPDWVFKLAVRYGGYQGTKAEALAQHPTLRQKLRLARLTRGNAL